ncbi:MAG: DUF1674 domain-containing protein [Xanthomonadales bacterium]|mgnify:CR=1 FL=1|nr:DUF1674 domain-containing protein [Xanthomonadales bacterium]|tara:strand:- start:296 stop:544 length:249 start_codon:yes stop_codon:yes gene_type:complete
MNDTEACSNPPKSATTGGTRNHDSGAGDPGHKDSGSPRGGRDAEDGEASKDGAEQPREIGGCKGPDPVRYGDWEKNGRCIDF